MRRVVVLGGSGMLGSMVTEVLARDEQVEVLATVRRPELIVACRQGVPRARWLVFDVASGDGPPGVERCDWVVNAIGITKPLIREDQASDVERAVRINSLFPHRLAAWAKQAGARVLQIATDCVYSGTAGGYVESAPHGALDVYGKTKSLGECVEPWVHNLRCSIIGREPGPGKFLVEWLLGQPPGASVRGFTNHRWNGVTTLHFARVALGIVRAGVELPNVQHLVPGDEVNKAWLLQILAGAYGRTDLAVEPVPAPSIVDRTLQTLAPERSASLWSLAGYQAPPGIRQMVYEMAATPGRLAAALSGVAVG
jgi:dTDP-4-dehydrorhamnose reductase